MNKVVLPVLLLLLTACTTAAPTPLPAAAGTPLPSASPTPSPSLTQTPTRSASATPVPLAGSLSTQVNVRSGPGTGYESLGLLSEGRSVQVTGSDPTGEWYRILYADAPQGSAWVAARYVQLPEGTQVPQESTAAPSGPSGRVLQRLNVRSGPGTAFETLGTLEAGTQVSLRGKNPTASWFQIDYPAGPQGFGWVTAQYIQTDAVASLPVLDEYGNPVTPPAQTGNPAAAALPTATVGPAYADGDSASAPAVQVTFTAGDSTRLVYASQLSSPQGDGQDWIEFTPYSLSDLPARLRLSLECSGGSLQVELSQAGNVLADWGSLRCGQGEVDVRLTAGLPVLVKLSAEGGDELVLVSYRLSVLNLP